MTETGNDASNNFAIAMLANLNMRPGSAISDRNHQLLRVPEREDDVASALIEGVNRFMTTRLTMHGRRDASNQRSADWRQQ